MTSLFLLELLALAGCQEKAGKAHGTRHFWGADSGQWGESGALTPQELRAGVFLAGSIPNGSAAEPRDVPAA